jgi:hypothetical protein
MADEARDKLNADLVAECRRQPPQLETLARLLGAGADVNYIDKVGFYSALSLCAMRGSEDAARLLLEKGAEVNLTDNNGFTSLHVACSCGHESTAKLLLESGADPRLADRNGKTALDLARLTTPRNPALERLIADAVAQREEEAFAWLDEGAGKKKRNKKNTHQPQAPAGEEQKRRDSLQVCARALACSLVIS